MNYEDTSYREQPPLAGCAAPWEQAEKLACVSSSVRDATAPEPSLSIILDRIQDLNGRMALRVETLDAAVDRLAGYLPDTPSAPGGDTVQPVPSGFVDQAHDALNYADRLLTRLTAIQDRLCAAV